LVTSKTPTGTYRAPGRYEGSFFCERLVELAAKDLGIDPVEMRRRNLVTDAEMPYRLARVEPGDLYAETECEPSRQVTRMRCTIVSSVSSPPRKRGSRASDVNLAPGFPLSRE
jgi:xanthine dehydrogenase molybdopterin-binding subunit B